MVTLSILFYTIIVGKKTVKLFHISVNYYTQINVECFKLVSTQMLLQYTLYNVHNMT